MELYGAEPKNILPESLYFLLTAAVSLPSSLDRLEERPFSTSVSSAAVTSPKFTSAESEDFLQND